MKYPLTAQVKKRLEGFLELLDTQLTDKRQWGSLATYLLGLLSPLERKSLEPLAAQVCPCPYHGSAAHQQLQQFSTDSPWPDEPLRTTTFFRAAPNPAGGWSPSGRSWSPAIGTTSANGS
jgi:SRSO17 transposase